MANQDIPIIGPILNKILGTRNQRFVKRYLQKVEAINALEPKYRAMSDAEIRNQVNIFRDRFQAGETVEQMIADVFACAREGMDRAVGIRNIFNPAHKFDPSTLSPEGQQLYAQTKAQMDATPDAPPEGEFLGCNGPIAGWQQVDIPLALYEEVRKLYPESRPPFRSRPFDVQLIGGMVLAQGKIAEMRTGEGKTIVGPLAAYLASCERVKVHVVTVNDYLVQRDRDWTFPYFRALGLTVGAIHPSHMQGEHEKRRMYMCDITYGTTSEFGFDYLRDNMKPSADQQVQKRRQFAIVDEVDSTLIDEARTPLIISGMAHDDQPRYELADKLARHLVQRQGPWQAADDAAEGCKRLIKGIEGDMRNARDKSKIPDLQARLKKAHAEFPRLEAEKNKFTQFYDLQMERKSVHLTHDGVAEAQRVAGVGSIYVGENIDLPHRLEQALRAHVVYQRDKDYVVMKSENPQNGRMEDSIVIVDVSTGRPMIGRQWSDGLHQACEFKEGVPIRTETQTVATITIQNFFKMYKRLAGMTGTADTEAQEFHDIYKLDVVAIPTNKPVRRRDYDDLVFLTEKDKWDFIVEEIKAFHDVGRPVLVGTTSVEKSEMLSKMLSAKYGVKHEVLNAKQHEREAHIVENAGQLGAVMIATNMAGRGTDIKLGPITRATLLDHWLRREIAPREANVEMTDEQLRECCYRKIATRELKLAKHEVEKIPFADLELRLLRHWAERNTLMSESQVAKASADDLREELDKNGRFLLHRFRWFETIEALGGLHVIGTERHESRRIDNQLRGRSGRQGDKGSSRFFIALEDDLMKLFAGETTQRALALLGMREGDAIEHSMLSKSVERAQRKVEERNFQVRKNILEYDEVMEHQRQKFYGLRQRVLDGRDMRGIIFDYIRAATVDATGDYLSEGYTARCASEFAKQKIEANIPATRLRGLDRHEMEVKIRRAAKDDAHNLINMTLGEYLPDMNEDGVKVDFDAAGLCNWARTHYGVEMTPDELGDGGEQVRRMLTDRLSEAADAKIEQTDLSGLDEYLATNYGKIEMTKWVKTKFDIDMSDDQITAAYKEGGNEAVVELIVKQAEEKYRTKEVEYPVNIAMTTAMIYAQQFGPAIAFEHIARYAKARYQLDWSPDKLMGKNPQTVKNELTKASESYFRSGKLEEEVQAALANDTPDKMEKYFKDRFNYEIPEAMKYMTGEERTLAIRARVESILREELTQLERTLLLSVLDDTWRHHLHTMDQLRDGIGFRAYSQQDPRIEFKREGSRIFSEVMVSIRDRVTDWVFKASLMPQPPLPPPPWYTPPQRPAAAPMSFGGGMISGPGLA
ncbi:MAG: preprotein translocase subunit SecA [Phycisphaerales bacterium]